jgi:DnaJ-class molecular chaperone
MTLSADTWLKMRYPDTTCGGSGTVAVGIVKQQCPDCKGTGLDERRIIEDTAKNLIPKWVLEQRTLNQPS